MLISLWVIATLTFVMMHLAPGGPFASEKKLPPQIIANLEAQYNLDKPLPVQYALYMKNLIMFDLGPSIKSEARNVNDILADGFPVSAQLGLEAMVIAVLAGLIMGIIASLRHNRVPDYTVMFLAVVGLAVPSLYSPPSSRSISASSGIFCRSPAGVPLKIPFSRPSRSPLPPWP